MAEAKDSEGRDQKKYDVMGIGNALMDILVSLPEEKFLTFRIEKGTMSLVNEARVKEIEEKLLGHEQSLEPGGASANTLSCLALLGSKVIFVGTVGKDRHGDIYEKKLIDTSLPFSELKKQSLINERAKGLDKSPAFSQKIRAGLPGFKSYSAERNKSP